MTKNDETPDLIDDAVDAAAAEQLILAMIEAVEKLYPEGVVPIEVLISAISAFTSGTLTSRNLQHSYRIDLLDSLYKSIREYIGHPNNRRMQ